MRLPLLLSLSLLPTLLPAQTTLSGSVQSDMMLAPQQDDKIGTAAYDNESFLTNTYLDLSLQSKHIDAGGRLEFTRFPMPGFQDAANDFKGWGVPNLWVKGRFKLGDVTLGTFYDQFGSGFIFRSYEERSLGIDNSIAGLRLALQPFHGLSLKMLTGLQRSYWSWEKNLITGADAELQIEEYLPALQQRSAHLMLGASWVNKHESNDDVVMADVLHKLNLPRYTNAVDLRLHYQQKSFALLAEYAHKSQDPNSLNSYIYADGHAELLSLTYADKGLSLLAQAKRSENMGFRSDRMAPAGSRASYLNHLPAFTVDQTYSLAALRPYATQQEGEWAYQTSAAYRWKGRFAPKLKVNYSLIYGLENARQNHNNSKMYGTDGAKSAFWKHGDVYYQDLDLIYDQKLSKSFEHHVMYMYQQYNKTIVEGEGGNIYSHIFVYEPKMKLNKKTTLRAELQYLYTAHESGNWGFGLMELSLAPYLMFSVSDQIGKCEPLNGSTEYGEVTHYYNFAVTGNYHSHRLQLSYGRTRAGFNCNGGVCRFIPASKGLTVNYNYNF